MSSEQTTPEISWITPVATRDADDKLIAAGLNWEEPRRRFGSQLTGIAWLMAGLGVFYFLVAGLFQAFFLLVLSVLSIVAAVGVAIWRIRVRRARTLVFERD